MKTRLTAAVCALLIALAFGGCAKKSDERTGESGGIEVKGSDTMSALGAMWADEFQKSDIQAKISVSGGGSGTGITALIHRNADMAQSSREIKPEEIDRAKEEGIEVQEFVVAQDGISVIVNPKNSVGKLTMQQLSDVYNERIKNWKELGGADKEIVLLSRDRSSGTHVFFLEHVLRMGDSKSTAEYTKATLMMPSNQAIADVVARTEGTIGYVGMGFVDPTKHKAVPVAADENSPYVEPSVANVLNHSYPIARPLYFYTAGEPTGKLKDFIDFVLSDEGQKIVEERDFVPVR